MPRNFEEKKTTAMARAKARAELSKALRRADEEGIAKALGMTIAELRAKRAQEADMFRPKGSTIVPRPTRQERELHLRLQEEYRRRSAGTVAG